MGRVWDEPRTGNLPRGWTTDWEGRDGSRDAEVGWVKALDFILQSILTLEGGGSILGRKVCNVVHVELVGIDLVRRACSLK